MKSYIKILLIVIFPAAAGIIIIWLGIAYTDNKPLQRGVALQDIKELYPQETRELGQVIIKTYEEFRGNTYKWSAAYFGCLFGSAFLSAMAALILKLELLGNRPKLRNDLAASLATIATLLITLVTIGDFQRKWQANRLAASAMENLAYELARISADQELDGIFTRIQIINDRRNRSIVGEPSEIEPKDYPDLPERSTRPNP